MRSYYGISALVEWDELLNEDDVTRVISIPTADLMLVEARSYLHPEWCSHTSYCAPNDIDSVHESTPATLTRPAANHGIDTGAEYSVQAQWMRYNGTPGDELFLAFDSEMQDGEVAFSASASRIRELAKWLEAQADAFELARVKEAGK
ncbi:hypothetical protein [Arthrobacter ginkgonis]|uniref:hypothetical protein n=1 Tax=Arthrobacter ginkgonis TaxID=1630594 RepID=UPI0031EC4514